MRVTPVCSRPWHRPQRSIHDGRSASAGLGTAAAAAQRPKRRPGAAGWIVIAFVGVLVLFVIIGSLTGGNQTNTAVQATDAPATTAATTVTTTPATTLAAPTTSPPTTRRPTPTTQKPRPTTRQRPPTTRKPPQTTQAPARNCDPAYPTSGEDNRLHLERTSLAHPARSSRGSATDCWTGDYPADRGVYG